MESSGRSIASAFLALSIAWLVVCAGNAESAEGETESITGFSPDMVMECDSQVAGRDIDCRMLCYNVVSVLTGGSGPPSVTVPPIDFPFERLEFYSEPGRHTENWLVAIRDKRMNPDGSKMTRFATIGTANICRYDATPPSQVVLRKLYERPSDAP